MRTISENFRHHETLCKCGCGRFSADITMVNRLEWLRQRLGNRRIFVHSWYRCIDHNNRPRGMFNRYGVEGVGSNSDSWHPTGGAVDFDVEGVEHSIVQSAIREKYFDTSGVGLYSWGIHWDIRPDRVDWRG